VLALQVSPDGKDVQCLADSGNRCVGTPWCYQWQRCLAAHPSIVLPAGIKTLSCGEQHKQLWGDTGYDFDRHWCLRTAIAAGGCQVWLAAAACAACVCCCPLKFRHGLHASQPYF
jgi:hypothetical protein